MNRTSIKKWLQGSLPAFLVLWALSLITNYVYPLVKSGFTNWAPATANNLFSLRRLLVILVFSLVFSAVQTWSPQSRRSKQGSL